MAPPVGLIIGRFRRQLGRMQGNVLDTWHRLKPWVRTTIRGVVTILLGLGFGYTLALHVLPDHKAAPAEPTVISIAVPNMPSATDGGVTVAITPPMGDKAATPAAAPQVDNEPALRQMLNAKIELRPAPLPSLLSAGQDGMLPRIADDGMEPWRAYSRPQAPLPAGVGAIAVVIVDAGLSVAETQAAIAALPGAVDFAFNVYSANLPDQINTARAAGHEAILDVPMEPASYPLDDPGPETLLTQLTPQQNLRQFHAFLARGAGTFAVTSSGGNQFVTEAAAMAPLLQDLKRRGLGWIDLTASDSSVVQPLSAQMQLLAAPKASADIVVLDTVLTPAKLQAALDSAVARAATGGGIGNGVIIVARPYPLSVKTLAAFANTLPAKNIALVPASALLAVPAALPAVDVPVMAEPAEEGGAHE